MAERLAFVIAIIFLILALAMFIITVIYFIFWRPQVSEPKCSTNNDCQVGQICQADICVVQSCTGSCNSGVCLEGFCTPQNCLSGNDCPSGFACVGGTCVQLGATCSDNSDCFNLTCKNGVCVECNQNSNCPTGQGCFDFACRYPNDGETGTAMITYISPSQSYGNIIAPPAYFCPTDACGTGNGDPISCTINTDCPANCSSCVNNVCRCIQGDLYETCTTNSDCQSGLCDNEEKICIPIGGECAFNFNGESPPIPLSCNSVNPYCVNGICSKSSDGALCGGTGVPNDLCYNPQSVGGIGGSTGMAPFCVNGRCQLSPGLLNQMCTNDESCQYLSSSHLHCVNNRCI